MAASDYISLVQHQQVRAQRYRNIQNRGQPEHSPKRVRAPRPKGMVGGRYPYYGNINTMAWGWWGTPHPDQYGEQYDPEGDDAGGNFGI